MCKRSKSAKFVFWSVYKGVKMENAKKLHETEIKKDGLWMLVELLGHNRIAGFVTEEEKWGQVLMRIDIPTHYDFDKKELVFTTQFYGTHALYCATPILESDAIELAKQLRPKPFGKFDLHKESSMNLDEIYGNDSEGSF